MAQTVKNLPAMQETWFDPWIGKIPWRRKWPPTPVFLPGEFHGQRSLVGYSPWGRKESDTKNKEKKRKRKEIRLDENAQLSISKGDTLYLVY